MKLADRANDQSSSSITSFSPVLLVGAVLVNQFSSREVFILPPESPQVEPVTLEPLRTKT